LQATSAAAGGGVLRDKDRVPSEWGLLPIVRKPGRRQSRRHEAAGVLEHPGKPSVTQVRPLALFEPEPAPERRAGERGEHIVKRSHFYSYCVVPKYQS
jgi:hypothetical protein